MNNISVILPAEVIPPNSIVTKLNGTKEYQLVKHINVWLNGKIVNKISSDDNTKFILQTDGNANVVTNDTQLIWKTNADTLFQFLENILDPDDYK